MKFPVTIRYRALKAKVYAPSKNFPYYRLAYQANGKRKVRTFGTYSEAKDAGTKLLKDASTGSQAHAFTARQTRDAMAAMSGLPT